MMKGKLFFALLIALVSCDNNEGIPARVIYVEPGEFIQNDKFRLVLNFKTQAQYSCLGYSLIKSETITGNSININFSGVQDPGGVCLAATGPASASVDLTDLASGAYGITIGNSGDLTEGVLIISDSDVVLNISRRGTIIPTKSKVKRTPKGTYFGSIGYHKASSIDDVNKFIEQVRNMNGVINVNQQTPGEYTYYTIGEDGKIEGNVAGSGYNFLETLIFQYAGDDEDTFRDEIDSIATTYVDEMSIFLAGYSGKKVANYSDSDE